MDHDTDIDRAGTAAGDATTRTPTNADTPKPATTTAGDPATSGQGGGGTSSSAARRRRRRGGRGRGGRGGGGGTGTASGTDTGAGTDTASGSDAASEGTAPAPAAGARTTSTPAPISDTGSARTQGTAATGARSPGRPPRARQPGSGTGEPKTTGERRPKEAAATAPAVPAAEPPGDAQEPDDGPGTSPEAADAQATPRPRSRRRRGGRGRGGKPKPASTDEAAEDVAAGRETPATQRDDAMPEEPATAPRSGKGRGQGEGGQRQGRQQGQDRARGGAQRSDPSTLEERVAAGGPTRGIKGTRSRTGRDGRRRRESVTPPPRITDKLMVITEHGERDQIAVLEEKMLVQHYVTRIGATSMVGNVYLGRVQNVLPGMEAAFVDVGRGRNGVLYAGEVNYDPADVEGPAPRIEQLLKPGQAVMVQVTKDPMGGKGARLTANLSLAGRYLVLAPNQDLQGISRRLGDDARKRLKAMLKRVKPPEHGVIVRTAAEGVSEPVLEADLRRLLSIWDHIQASERKAKAPAVLYEEPELTVRVVRDLFTDEEFKALVTDSPRVHGKVTEYLGEVAPDLAEKVHLHEGPLPAFEEHRVVEQIHKALDKKVWLPSGGYLFIERTEAMTIVDVNTGKSVGKTNLEETVVNTNLEAAREVARQLRLRDIGGIIVIDFIDMLLEKNKRQVEDTMREELARDKTRSQVFEIGPLGLMQVTRKRVSSGLVESFSETCPTCEGRGFLLTYDVN